jgi:hypothetical protein
VLQSDPKCRDLGVTNDSIAREFVMA